MSATHDAINRLLPRLRAEYPNAKIGILGTVNLKCAPLCQCGSHDLLLVWRDNERKPIKICPHCRGQYVQLSLLEMEVA